MLCSFHFVDLCPPDIVGPSGREMHEALVRGRRRRIRDRQVGAIRERHAAYHTAMPLH